MRIFTFDKKAIAAVVLVAVIIIMAGMVSRIYAVYVEAPRGNGSSTSYMVSYFNYSISSAATTTTVTVTSAGPYAKYGDLNDRSYKTTMSGTGQTSKTYSLARGTYKKGTKKDLISTNLVWSWTRGCAAATKTLKATTKGYNGTTLTATSVASTTITVPAHEHYSVSFNANGGSGAPAAQTKCYGTSISLTSVKPVRTGYTFKCWNTSSGGTGTAYSPGGTYSVNASVVLYAIWTPNNYNVTLKGNGSGAADGAVTVTFAGTANNKVNIPKREGYMFDGYYTAAEGGVRAYDRNGIAAAGAYWDADGTAAKWKYAGTVTLYAHWTEVPAGKNSYHIVFGI